MKNTCVLVFTFFFSINPFKSIACGPCADLSGITQTLSGNNLALTFTSNAGWPCCYNVVIEIVCANSNFTGVGNYSSATLCLSPSAMTNVPYPITNINISSFCSGTYKWRAKECNGNWTPEYQFTISNPSQLTITASNLLLCVGESSNLNATASLCGSGPFNYSWSPAVGLSNTNISNPIATPNSTTTYTVTATGTTLPASGGCPAVTSEQITITVNPLPVATISNTVSVCQNDPSPNVTFSGSGGTAPYTINYNLNGFAQTPVVTTGTNFIIPAPTNVPGTYIYSIVDITESSSLACSQDQNSTITITVNHLPVANFTDICGNIPATLTNTTTGAVNYYWDMGDGSPIITSTDISYIFSNLESIDYNITLIAESEFGCRDTTSKRFITPLFFYVPNTFTPDGNEYNNTFSPVFSNKDKVENYNFLIYNRWGEIIFETKDIGFGWDGTLKNREAQDGTYLWELIYRDISCTVKREYLHGHVNLIR
jgi:gliding motility-associated-like protein